MPRPRTSLVVLAAAVACLGAPAGASARLPVVAATPAIGTSSTTFTIVVPKRIADRRGRGALVSAFPSHRRARCTRRVLPPTRVRRDGTIRVTLDPEYLQLRGGKWCTGRYRVLVTSEVIVDDDDQTGEGGSTETRLARSSFVVRR